MAGTTIRFWGVRGSVPTPISTPVIQEKMKKTLQAYHNACELAGHLIEAPNFFDRYTSGSNFPDTGTYGGNTSCVEIVMDGQRFVLDMGTGMGPLGASLVPEMFREKGLSVVFLLSHVHWDHIQGLPFFAPIYINKALDIKNQWAFYGGIDWQKTAEVCLRGQMDAPVFPVSWREIEKITYHPIIFGDVYHRMTFSPLNRKITVTCGKLDHPQETYGWRLQGPDGHVVVYTTDNEPRDPEIPDSRLVELARDADIWITDCQYTRDVYNGKVGGVPRHGWGHSYPEAVARTAAIAGVKRVILFHHDPMSSDEKIYEMQEHTLALLEGMRKTHIIGVTAAHEGLTINL